MGLMRRPRRAVHVMLEVIEAVEAATAAAEFWAVASRSGAGLGWGGGRHKEGEEKGCPDKLGGVEEAASRLRPGDAAAQLPFHSTRPPGVPRPGMSPGHPGRGAGAPGGAERRDLAAAAAGPGRGVGRGPGGGGRRPAGRLAT